MARPRRREYDTPEFHRLWHSDTPTRVIAKRYGVSCPSIHRAAKKRGFPCKWRFQKGGAPKWEDRCGS